MKGIIKQNKLEELLKNNLVYLLILYFFISKIFNIWKYELQVSIGELVALFALIIFVFLFLKKAFSHVKLPPNKRNLLLVGVLYIILFFPFLADVIRKIYVINLFIINSSINHLFIEAGILLTFYLAIFYFVYNSRSSLKHLSIYLSLLVLILLVYEIGIQLTYKPNNLKLENPVEISAIGLKEDNRPDVYYIILDCYTSSASLKKYWSYNNAVFQNFLKKSGFYIAVKSKSNYNYTPSSLSSSLNLSLLNVENNAAYSVSDIKKLDSFIKKNFVYSFFKKNGYQTNIYSIAKMGTNNVQMFGSKKFIQTKKLIFDLMGKFKKIYQTNDQTEYLHGCYTYNINSFRFLDSVANLKKSNIPRFSIIHTLTAHPPFVVDSSGNFSNKQSINPAVNKKQYINALKYINKRIESFVDVILQKPGPKPIIIIQGDHGSHLIDLEESSTILNAYYFPDKNYTALSPDITPVNSFRVIFNTYFDANLPYISNKTYHVSYGKF